MFMNGSVTSTPSMLNRILIKAIFIAILALKISVSLSKIKVNGFNKIMKNITVVILKKIEKWASFFPSLLQEKIVKRGSKLVPMFAPKMSGIAWCNEMNPDIASIWIIAMKTLEDCSAPVNKTPTRRLKKKLFATLFIYVYILGFSCKLIVE